MDGTQTIVSKEEIIQFLATCSGNELNEVLNRALDLRPENQTLHDWEQKRLVLGEAWRFLQDGKWTGWEFWPVADMDTSEYPRDFEGEPFLQNGTCENCGVEVSSHVKMAVCPLCSGKVFLT